MNNFLKLTISDFVVSLTHREAWLNSWPNGIQIMKSIQACHPGSNNFLSITDMKPLIVNWESYCSWSRFGKNYDCWEELFSHWRSFSVFDELTQGFSQSDQSISNSNDDCSVKCSMWALFSALKKKLLVTNDEWTKIDRFGSTSSGKRIVVLHTDVWSTRGVQEQRQEQKNHFILIIISKLWTLYSSSVISLIIITMV